MRDFSIAIKTHDRTPRGGRNYLEETLDNFCRATALTDVSHGLYIARGEGRTLHQNAREAIRMAAEHPDRARWVMVLEDDLDFCDGFLDSALRWLEDHASDERLMYAFGANYDQIRVATERGLTAWHYPVDAFYGAQALAWKREDAAELAEWLGPDPFYRSLDKQTGEVTEIRDHGHDLLLQHWGRHRGVTHFLASAPSFVQHIGRQSGIGNGSFQFTSWPGRDYRYEGRGIVVPKVGAL